MPQKQTIARFDIITILLVLSGCSACRAELSPITDLSLPVVTHSGYLDVSKDDGSQIFYTFYEAQEQNDDAPIILWLQGGPGCAGHFGSFFELGPELVGPNLALQPNPGAWNRIAGLIFVDQPVGTGFSPSGSGRIPDNEDEIAADVYVALQHFFKQHAGLASRAFFIAGESYAGKYIPAIGHFILQLEEATNPTLQLQTLKGCNAVCQDTAVKAGNPRFRLSGLAIGNGLTDPAIQVQQAAASLHFTGLIGWQQYLSAQDLQARVAQAISKEDWEGAALGRLRLLEFFQEATGVGTLLDYRRVEDYDSDHLVDLYLNQPIVKAHLGAHQNITFVSCSDRVGRVLHADVMKSVKSLIPGLLKRLPVLLYQGAFDCQDGPAGQEAWIHSLPWYGKSQFATSIRQIWRALADGSIPQPPQNTAEVGSEFINKKRDKGAGRGRVLGYWREWGTLTHVIIRDAGHMVPRDDPLTTRAMMESWLTRSMNDSRSTKSSLAVD